VRTNIQVRFGAKVVGLRAERGWTQEDLAERTTITVKHISSLENGHREPCLGVLVKLAKSFGVSLPELLGGIEN
jgi:transcriptional regulator with XRE-family HTH domain